MATLLRVPEVAAGEARAVLTEWLTTENTTFVAGNVLALLETDKAVVEIEAETDAMLLRVLVPAGSDVEVGAPIAVVGQESERGDVARLLAESGVHDDPATPVTATAQPADSPAGAARRVFTSPLARRLLKEAGLPIEQVRGTGPHGRIVRRDVERAIADAADRPVESAAPTSEPSTVSREEVVPPATYTEIPHSRIRRAIAHRLTVAKQTVPHYYLRRAAHIDDLLALRAQVNALSPVRISVNDLIVRAVGAAYRAVPEANVTWDDACLHLHHQVDVGVAVASDRGLVTPVLRDVNRVAIGELAQWTRDVVARADAGTLRQHELEGGVLTISNLGMYGIDEFAAIISPPQSAILAVGAARPVPAIVDGAVRPRTEVVLTLSMDHRAVDGALGARLLAAIVEAVEQPLRLLL